MMKVSDGKITLTRIGVAVLSAAAAGVLCAEWLPREGAQTDTFFIRAISELVRVSIFYLFVAAILHPKKISIYSLIFGVSGASKRPSMVSCFAILMLSCIVMYSAQIFFGVAGYFLHHSDKLFEYACSSISGFDPVSNAQKSTNWWAISFGPLAEEIFFRGLLLGVLLNRFNTSTAVAVSAAIFSVFHGGDWAAALIGGMYLGFLYVTYKRLDVCVAAHIAANALIEVSEQRYFGAEELFKACGSGVGAAVNVAIMLFVVLALALCMIRFSTKKHQVHIFA